MVAVDATESPALQAKYGVQGFPTLKIFGQVLAAYSSLMLNSDSDDVLNFMFHVSCFMFHVSCFMSMYIFSHLYVYVHAYIG